MATLNEMIVKHICNGILFREAQDSEISYWSNRLDLELTTPSLLTLGAADQSTFMDQNLHLATMYYNVFGTYPPISEMMFWRSVLDNGASLIDIGSTFADSNQFYELYPSAKTSNSAKLVALISSSGVNNISNALKTEAITALNQGTLQWGSVVKYLSDYSGKHQEVGLSLLWSALNSSIPTTADISTLGNDRETAVSKIFTGYLTTTTDAQTNANDVFVATAGDDTIRTGIGDDTITTGNGIDRIVFEATSALNGIDTIKDFTIGLDGDILDFTLFLNQPNNLNIDTVESVSTNEIGWSNGDILVLSGYNLTTSTNIAAAFGTGLAFAAPNGASKAVIITADIIGDATVWYIVNQTDTANITGDEITKVATLSGINNLTLIGFDTTNFAV